MDKIVYSTDPEVIIKDSGRTNTDGREFVSVNLNGLNYMGLASYQKGEEHIYIPEVGKTFIIGKKNRYV